MILNVKIVQGVIHPLLLLTSLHVYTQTNHKIYVTDCTNGELIETFSLYNENGNYLKTFAGYIESSFLNFHDIQPDTLILESFGYPKQKVAFPDKGKSGCMIPLNIDLEEVSFLSKFSAKESLIDLIKYNVKQSNLNGTKYYKYNYIAKCNGMDGFEHLTGILNIDWSAYSQGKWQTANYHEVNYEYDSTLINSPIYSQLPGNRIQHYINFVLTREPDKLIKTIKKKRSNVQIDRNNNSEHQISFVYQPYPDSDLIYHANFNRSDSLLISLSNTITDSKLSINDFRCISHSSHVTYAKNNPFLISEIDLKERYLSQEKIGVDISFTLSLIESEEVDKNIKDKNSLKVSTLPNMHWFKANQWFFEMPD